MVYIINAESCYDSMYNLAKIRNQLFTAITRSKAWVRILGVGEDMKKLIKEYTKIKNNNFTLDFIYPDKSQRKKMNIINRDISEGEKNEIRKSRLYVRELINRLENKEIFKDDLNKEQIERLINLLEKGE